MLLQSPDYPCSCVLCCLQKLFMPMIYQNLKLLRRWDAEKSTYFAARALQASHCLIGANDSPTTRAGLCWLQTLLRMESRDLTMVLTLRLQGRNGALLTSKLR